MGIWCQNWTSFKLKAIWQQIAKTYSNAMMGEGEVFCLEKFLQLVQTFA